jgi:hypothetical protein
MLFVDGQMRNTEGAEGRVQITIKKNPTDNNLLELLY